MNVNAVLYAIDPATNNIYPVTIDPAGHIQIDVLSVPTVNVNGYGWYSGAWRKNPLENGISTMYEETWSNPALPAGNTSIDSSVVPANTIRVITNVVFMHAGVPPTQVYIRKKNTGGVYRVIFAKLAPVNGDYHDRQGMWPLFPGEAFNVLVIGAAAGDALYAEATGYNIDII